jgi:hypothetical protein
MLAKQALAPNGLLLIAAEIIPFKTVRVLQTDVHTNLIENQI